jgi:signal transduction histidine kinase
MLYADVNQMHQVINNLLINASQASKSNEEIIITVKKCEVKQSESSVLRTGSYFAVSIKDNGVGIDDHQSMKLLYSAGFNSPNFTQLFISIPNALEGNPNLKV